MKHTIKKLAKLDAINADVTASVISDVDVFDMVITVKRIKTIVVGRYTS